MPPGIQLPATTASASEKPWSRLDGTTICPCLSPACAPQKTSGAARSRPPTRCVTFPPSGGIEFATTRASGWGAPGAGAWARRATRRRTAPRGPQRAASSLSAGVRRSRRQQRRARPRLRRRALSRRSARAGRSSPRPPYARPPRRRSRTCGARGAWWQVSHPAFSSIKRVCG